MAYASRAYEYGVLLKPKVLLAMLALYASSYLSSYLSGGAAYFDFKGFFIGLMAVAAAVSGANALNCYIDKDIDSLMARTWGRPLAMGTIGSWQALTFSAVLLTFAAAISLSLGLIPFLLFAEGSITYLAVYTVLLKRRTRLNVFATAPSVAAPAWFGWHMGGSPLISVGFLMGLLVAIWGPLHLWSLAFAYSKDYAKVGVPMLPAVATRDNAIISILGALALLMGASYLLVPWAESAIYIVGISFLNLVLLFAGLKFYKKQTNKAGWWLFKLTAPYIVFILLFFMIDQILFS